MRGNHAQQTKVRIDSLAYSGVPLIVFNSTDRGDRSIDPLILELWSPDIVIEHIRFDPFHFARPFRIRGLVAHRDCDDEDEDEEEDGSSRKRKEEKKRGGDVMSVIVSQWRRRGREKLDGWK